MYHSEANVERLKRHAAVDGWLSTLERKAALRDSAGLRRELRPRGPSDAAIDLAGNDYLGLSRHPDVVAAATAALAEYGLGATGSRLVRGSTDAHTALESSLADLLGVGSALVYSSGYLANVGAVRALAGPHTLVVSDAHNHASIVDGCRIAVRDKASAIVTPHSDIAAVDRALAAHAGRPALVVTATLSKSLGAAGGVIAGPAQVRRHLLDTGRTFIYDTALPPAVAAGAAEALRLLRDGDDLRAELADRAAHATGKLRAAGLDVPEPAAGVLSVTAPGPEAAVAWAAACRERGVAVGCFRPPSTPDSRSRLRLTVNVGVARADFEHAIDVILASRP